MKYLKIKDCIKRVGDAYDGNDEITLCGADANEFTHMLKTSHKPKQKFVMVA